jgi:hypothetical protein
MWIPMTAALRVLVLVVSHPKLRILSNFALGLFYRSGLSLHLRTGNQRKYSRFNSNHLGSHCRKSSTSTEAKIPKIVTSSPSTEKYKLDTIYSTNGGSPKVIKSHEGSEKSNNKSKS